VDDPEKYDVLVVGGGLMGAAVARNLRDRDPRTRILVIDGGPVIGSVPGQHLHDVAERELWERYNARVATGIQGFYAGRAPTGDLRSSLAEVDPGVYNVSSLGEEAAEMPAASVAWNCGGMGVHWTAATPTPWGEEIPVFVDADEWRADLERACELLRVDPAPYPLTEAGRAVTAAIAQEFAGVDAPGRSVQPMPMAVRRDPSGVLRRTGPNVIFPPIAEPGRDPRFTLATGTRAVRLLHEDAQVRGAVLQDVVTGATREVQARATVVCADTFRTPQLLFASGIRPPALGRYLNEHAFLSGQVLADPERLGFDVDALPLQRDDEPFIEHFWQPHGGAEQPFQFQIGARVFADEDRRPLAYAVGLVVYVPTEISAQNRLEFSEELTDAAGMPRITVHFSYSPRDLELIERARKLQRSVAERLGSFDPETESMLLPAGCSLHFTGTVRMGPHDDGTNVCDPKCRVMGFDNLFIAGNGVVPTALACNSTLIGMTTAVRAARALGQLLDGEPPGAGSAGPGPPAQASSPHER
jgi:choline dehydrogenase-like flavoprotein